MAIDIHMPPNDDEGVDMAPMVDMVFLLLIFFMVASHLNQMEKVEIEVPIEEHAKVPKQMHDRRTITIRADGAIYLGNVPAKLEDVKPLVEKERLKTPGLKVYIRADKSLDYSEVRKVMEACAAAGAAEILFAAHEK